jgi:hypothetical protein
MTANLVQFFTLSSSPANGRTVLTRFFTHDVMEQIEDHPLVTFLPLDLTNPNSIENVLSHIDNTMQYGEHEEPREVGASPVCSRLPCVFAPLHGRDGRGLHFILSWKKKCEADCLLFYFTSSSDSHDRIPDRVTYAFIPADTRLKRAFHHTPPRLPTALLSLSPHCVNGGPQPLLYFHTIDHVTCITIA